MNGEYHSAVAVKDHDGRLREGAAGEPAYAEIAQLAALICQAPVAVITLISDGTFSLKACFGIDPDSLPEDRSFCEELTRSGEDMLVVPDARLHPLFSKLSCVTSDPGIRFYAGAALRSPEGQILGTLCVLDRTAHALRAEQVVALKSLGHQVVTLLELRQTIALRRAETKQLQLMGQAFHASSDGIVITDARLPDNPMIMANPAFERITGYSTAESMGRNCRFLQNDDRDQPGVKLLRNAIRKQQNCRVVLKNFRKDGRPFWNELHIAPVRDAGGEVTHFIGIQSDITSRKEADDALRQRDVILEGVSFATETLLNEPNLEEALPNVLEQIGTATGCDHVCLWQAQANNTPAPLAQIELWSSPDLPLANQAVLRAVPWDCGLGWPKPEDLHHGRVLQNGSVEITLEEKTLLQTLGIDTFLFLPVLTDQGHFWGCLSLGSTNKAMSWGFAEIEALRSATRVLGSVIHDRETSAALRTSEERFRTVVTNLKEVVFQTDAVGSWTFLNPAWEEITGFSVGETVGQPFLNYVHEDDRERNFRLFGPLIRREKDYCRHEVRYLKKDGGFRWIEVFARLLLDSKNQTIGTTGTLNDITERKLAEQSLQKQRAAIEAAIDGVAILDEVGNFSYLNATLAGMFGRTEEKKLLGKSWRELFPTQELARFENEAIPQAQETGKWRGTLAAQGKDGRTFTAEISLTRIEGGGTVCVCRDITERIEAEQFVLNSLKEKEVLLKEIHHRVKNNMQIVSSLLNLQLAQLHDEHSRTLFMEAQNRIASMALVHEKLYQSNDLARIDFTEYLRELTDNLASMLGAKLRNIVFKLNCSSIQLGIDTAIPCGLIINELVSNAYKHAFPNGGPGMVTLSLARQDDGKLLLEMQDTGRGLPADLDVRKTKSLGMQLVHTLVQQLRGTIEMRSENGAHFTLRLQENIRKEPNRK
jgi:PAS domain S-box-containing protein